MVMEEKENDKIELSEKQLEEVAGRAKPFRWWEVSTNEKKETTGDSNTLFEKRLRITEVSSN